MDFLMILARFGGPSCGHVGDIFGKNGASLWGAPRFVVVWCFCLNFLSRLSRFLAPNLPPGGEFGPISFLIMDLFWADFGLMLH